MNKTQLLRALGLTNIIGADYETFYDTNKGKIKGHEKYSLRSHTTSEYIHDSRFKTHCVSVQGIHDSRPTVMTDAEWRSYARTVNWNKTGFLAHHAHFDGLITSYHYGANPAFMLDTLSMARAIMPVQVGGRLDDLGKALGLGGKEGAEALEALDGVLVPSAAQMRALKKYAGRDLSLTWQIFWKLLPFFPEDELQIIDTTVQMFTNPCVLINAEKMRQVVADEQARKEELLGKAKVDRSELSSNEPFAAQLRALGVEPPMKIKPALKKRVKDGYDPKYPTDYTYAFSRTDLEFKDLLKHGNKKIRALVEARLAIKSTNLEKKAGKLADRSVVGRVPIYLNYSGARTHRWSGADGVNFQNMNRGSDMRKAMEAPEGYVFVIADQAQIEARMNAWYAGQHDVVDIFRRGEDVYSHTATGIYGRVIDKDKDPDERFVGKTATLGLGYQAGAPRFADMLRIGQFGPPIDISDAQAKSIVTAWRQANYAIVANWKATQNMFKQAMIQGVEIEDRFGVSYQGVHRRAGNRVIVTGYTHHRPTGMSIRYDDVQVDEDGSVSYMSAYRRNVKAPPTIERTKLYGGIEVENRTQFMARQVLATQMVDTKRRVNKSWGWRHASTTHDEILGMVKKQYADKAHALVHEIMTTELEWTPGLPFGVDSKVSPIYNKT